MNKETQSNVTIDNPPPAINNNVITRARSTATTTSNSLSPANSTLLSWCDSVPQITSPPEANMPYNHNSVQINNRKPDNSSNYMGTPSSVKGKASETVPNYYAARKKKEVIGSQMDFMLIKTLQDFNDPKSTQETKQCEE